MFDNLFSISCDPLCHRIWRPAAASVILLTGGAHARKAACCGALVRIALCGAAECEVEEQTEALSDSGGSAEAGGAGRGVNSGGDAQSEPGGVSSAGVGEEQPSVVPVRALRPFIGIHVGMCHSLVQLGDEILSLNDSSSFNSTMS
eukprot:6487334-Amphidinium_carterae.1